MKVPRSVHTCQSCGHREARWHGRCPGCGEWSSMVEERVARPAPAGALGAPTLGPGLPVPIAELAPQARARLATGVAELDRVLGGGLVPGSLVLLGGDPGVGKSTLLLGALEALARPGRPVLYVSGEESVEQTALRAARIGARAPTLAVLAETQLERLLQAAEAARPDVLAVDSVQTLHAEALESIPGSVGQVREAAGRLLTFAKATGTATVLVGHVTKDGALAGPKTLEHVVDVVLYFEGEGGAPYRTLRAAKNRFGSTRELGVFEMREEGLLEVPNPSERFLAERPLGVPGSVVLASAEGSRPILVEVQALVSGSSAGSGRRAALGVDAGRVALLLAVLERRAGIDVGGRDVFVNVAGGVRLGEPAADLAIACAVASSARARAAAADTLVFGEVGLAGEVRGVAHAELRLREAARLGFRRVLLPEANRARVSEELRGGLELCPVRSIDAALDVLLG